MLNGALYIPKLVNCMVHRMFISGLYISTTVVYHLTSLWASKCIFKVL